MSVGLMLLVLLAAALHAGWNAMVKSSPDKSSDVVLVAVGAAAIAATTLPFIPLPTTSSWPYLIASVVIHLAYFSLVGLAYRHGDLSYVYPLMRGSAPLITTCAAILVVGEALRVGGYVGVLLLSAGVLALWAMTRAPLALVAALRETSVVFGTVFAAALPKEKFGTLRYVAAGLVTAGAVAMKVL
jgi:drug/metabolite transporter (DMT)-like permease